MGRTVDDVTLLHSVMVPAITEARPIPRAPRLAVSADLGDLPLDPAVRTVVEHAVGELESAGWAVEASLPDLAYADPCFEDLRALGFASRFNFRPVDPRIKEVVRAEVTTGMSLDDAQILRAAAIETRLQTTWDDFFTTYDVFACTTSQVPPFPLGQRWVEWIDGVPMGRYTDWMRSCSRISVPAGPSISIPAGFTEDGLPVGMQLCAARHHDQTLLALARLAEQVLSVKRRPPLERIIGLDPADLPAGPPPENT
jgi:amidase